MNNQTISTKSKTRSFIKSSWPIILIFFGMTLIDPRFGLLGFICMAAPLYLALTGKGKRHCSHYCPRGSFLGKFLPYISLDLPFPKWLESKGFKIGLLVWMFSIFGLLLLGAGTNLTKLAVNITRMMFVSFIVGILTGILFKPRSWCKICPMGNAAGMIGKALERKKGPCKMNS